MRTPLISFITITVLTGCNDLNIATAVGAGPTPPTQRPTANILQSTVLNTDMDTLAVIQDSNITLDCAGRALNKGMEITSKQANGQWIPPQNVTVKNCISRATIRVYGMARNGEGGELTNSSKQLGHTQRVQAAAPKYIRFENIDAQINGPIGFYFSPGVTHSEIINSRITGNAVSTSIYLDAESAFNRIINNTIATTTDKREQIAIDGSAYNQIIGNQFTNLKNGGIYLYRNCGEGGNVRHQTPTHNVIAENTFQHDANQPNEPSIWLASRNGNRLYCYLDVGVPFGSSISDLDYATDNIIERNTFINKQQIRVDAQPNTIRDNRIQ